MSPPIKVEPRPGHHAAGDTTLTHRRPTQTPDEISGTLIRNNAQGLSRGATPAIRVRHREMERHADLGLPEEPLVFDTRWMRGVSA